MLDVYKRQVLCDGFDLAIISTGLMTSEALKAAVTLKRQDAISVRVINMPTIKPQMCIRDRTRTSVFAKKYSERFFDCGIAECNMVGVEMCIRDSSSSVPPVSSTAVCFVTKNRAMVIPDMERTSPIATRPNSRFTDRRCV